jgi:hypothetical protein
MAEKSLLDRITEAEKRVERKIKSIEERLKTQNINLRSQQSQLTDQIYRLCQSIEALDRLKNPHNYQQGARSSVERLQHHLSILGKEIKRVDYLSGYQSRVEAMNTQLQTNKTTDEDDHDPENIDERRKCRIWAKVSEGELEKIVRMQEASGQKSLSAYVREKSLGNRIHVIPKINQAGSLNIAKLIRLTRNIASNFNQGIKAIHSARLSGEQVPWDTIEPDGIKVLTDLLAENLKVLTIIQKHLIRKHNKM